MTILEEIVIEKIYTGLETITLQPGSPKPLGATLLDGGINFAVFSAHATQCHLILFRKGAEIPFLEIPFEADWRFGHIFAVHIAGLHPDHIEYGYRMDGENAEDVAHQFDSELILTDPYARQMSGRNRWGHKDYLDTGYPIRSRIPTATFDWEGDRPLNTPIEDLVIYEMHVRAFTQGPSSGVMNPGTYAGLVEKIPYLQDLGINCVELLPVQEFDELKNYFVNPLTGEPLKKFWGYSTLGFFAPKAGYAASGINGGEINEFKGMVKRLHEAGIEVWLDVVYNHTGEGTDPNSTVSFRGIDNKTYYILTPDGLYHNFSGTGNTLNVNHPVVRKMIIDSLRYWVLEYHIDGFRFDLAAIFTRDQQGNPLGSPPLVEEIANDPILANTKIVAEAWDAGGLYQVGTFPHYNRWHEWNGKFRDTLRQFIKGDIGQTGPMVQRILGSPDIYHGRQTIPSINFITCHDGFNLHDLYSYNEKHNEANGEENRDGANDNNSWNCGAEGPTDDPDILKLRKRLMRNAIAILMLSQGTPLINMGDEINHTKQGNNNTYGHDNELNWLNWNLNQPAIEQKRFFKNLIAFRAAHPILRNNTYFNHSEEIFGGYPSISWHGTKPWMPDWSYHSHTIAFLLCDAPSTPEPDAADVTFIFAAVNMHWESHFFELPSLPDGFKWRRFLDTDKERPYDIVVPGKETLLNNQEKYLIHNRSMIILVGRL